MNNLGTLKQRKQLLHPNKTRHIPRKSPEKNSNLFLVFFWGENFFSAFLKGFASKKKVYIRTVFHKLSSIDMAGHLNK
jgi:hypothetical protein